MGGVRIFSSVVLSRGSIVGVLGLHYDSVIAGMGLIYLIGGLQLGAGQGWRGDSLGMKQASRVASYRVGKSVCCWIGRTQARKGS